VARESKKAAARGIRWRLWLGAAGVTALCISTAWAGFKVRDYALTNPEFALSQQGDALSIVGMQYASRAKIQSVFAADLERSVFAIPLAERRRRLLAIDWVEDASVARVWPRRVVVRIRERKPVAFAVAQARVMMIDAYGVLLDQPPQAHFVLPVLQGLPAEEGEPQRRVRVQAMLRMKDELGPEAKDISEINVADTENLRVIAALAGGGAAELILGNENFKRRYQNFLNHYPEILKRSPGVKIFDLRLEDRITVKD
jgi:cell division protein FtsQ